MKIYQLDRATPLAHFNDLSAVNDMQELGDSLTMQFSRNEYAVIQLVLLSEQAVSDIAVHTSFMTDGVHTLENKITCFQTEGVDKYGHAFRKQLSLSANVLQPVYFGIDLSCCSGESVSFQIKFEAEKTYSLSVILNLTDEMVEREGTNDLWRLSRLKWLNSTLAQDEKAVDPYTPVLPFDEEDIQTGFDILGRKITLAPNGMPSSVQSFFDEGILLKEEPQAELLASKMDFFAEGEEFHYEPVLLERRGDNANLAVHGESDHLTIQTEADIHYTGAMIYTVTLTAKEDCQFTTAGFGCGLQRDNCLYMNGMGKSGGAYADTEFHWNNYHCDRVYLGNVNCGLRMKFKAENYRHPLINIYYEALPLIVPETTWDNKGQGTFSTTTRENEVAFRCETGTYQMKKGETRKFLFELHFLPFRPVDYKKHYATRYYHFPKTRKAEDVVRTAKENGINCIIVHHANEFNSYINYPFIDVEEMKGLVDMAHAEGIKVKFYYTMREHSNHMAEVFVYKALGDEIILRKKWKGFPWQEGVSPWLTEHFGETIIPAWRVLHNEGKHKGDHDISFICRPDSRLENYYIEGLKWLVEEAHIDGIYVDDTSMTYKTLERARKILEPVNGLIDMHMCCHEEDCFGRISCMNLYTEIYPFIDSVWVGEGYHYTELSPEYLLTEVSGLPYGLTSQMLQDGGDPFIGMLYAMNARFGWHTAANTLPVYRLWDDFGIQDAQMLGYWHKKIRFVLRFLM